MKSYIKIVFLAMFALCVSVQTTLGDEKSPVLFPKSFDKGVVYFKNDRGAITEDIYTSKEVIKAVQAGKPLPNGTVITLVEYFSKNEKGKDGYALKGKLKRYVVMEKREEWSKSSSNGSWQYQVFNPDKTVQTTANLSSCFSCHASEKNNDFVFTLSDIKNVSFQD